MKAAGATRVRVEEYAAGEYLVASREHGAGVTSAKEEAFDTVQEVALHLVSRFVPFSAQPSQRDTEILSADAGLAAQTLASGQEESAAVVGDHAASSVIWPLDCASADSVDVELEPAEPTTLTLVEIDNGSERPLLTEEVRGFIPDEPTEHSVSQFIFGDNLALDRLVRQGQVADLAVGLIHDTKSNSRFSPDEFVELQNYVVSNLDAAGAFTGDSARYDRFVELSEAQSRVRAIEAERDIKIDFIRVADREAVACFDPTAGWPEF